MKREFLEENDILINFNNIIQDNNIQENKNEKIAFAFPGGF